MAKTMKAKKAVKARKSLKAKAARRVSAATAGKPARAEPKDVFRQPLEILQNGFSSVINYFK